MADDTNDKKSSSWVEDKLKQNLSSTAQFGTQIGDKFQEIKQDYKKFGKEATELPGQILRNRSDREAILERESKSNALTESQKEQLKNISNAGEAQKFVDASILGNENGDYGAGQSIYNESLKSAGKAWLGFGEDVAITALGGPAIGSIAKIGTKIGGAAVKSGSNLFKGAAEAIGSKLPSLKKYGNVFKSEADLAEEAKVAEKARREAAREAKREEIRANATRPKTATFDSNAEKAAKNEAAATEEKVAAKEAAAAEEKAAVKEENMDPWTGEKVNPKAPKAPKIEEPPKKTSALSKMLVTGAVADTAYNVYQDPEGTLNNVKEFANDAVDAGIHGVASLTDNPEENEKNWKEGVEEAKDKIGGVGDEIEGAKDSVLDFAKGVPAMAAGAYVASDKNPFRGMAGGVVGGIGGLFAANRSSEATLSSMPSGGDAGTTGEGHFGSEDMSGKSANEILNKIYGVLTRIYDTTQKISRDTSILVQSSSGNDAARDASSVNLMARQNEGGGSSPMFSSGGGGDSSGSEDKEEKKEKNKSLWDSLTSKIPGLKNKAADKLKNKAKDKIEDKIEDKAKKALTNKARKSLGARALGGALSLVGGGKAKLAKAAMGAIAGEEILGGAAAAARTAAGTVAKEEAGGALAAGAEKAGGALSNFAKSIVGNKGKVAAAGGAGAMLASQSLDEEFEKQGIADPYAKEAIKAKFMSETGGKGGAEQGYSHTSNSRIRHKLPQLAHLSDEELDELKKDDDVFFSKAYGESGTYRGRGLTQLTGKRNYEAADKALGLGGELVNNPGILATDKELDKRVSVWFYKNLGADKKNFSSQEEANKWAIKAAGGKKYSADKQLGQEELAKVNKIQQSGKNYGIVGESPTEVAASRSKSNSTKNNLGVASASPIANDMSDQVASISPIANDISDQGASMSPMANDISDQDASNFIKVGSVNPEENTNYEFSTNPDVVEPHQKWEKTQKNSEAIYNTTKISGGGSRTRTAPEIDLTDEQKAYENWQNDPINNPDPLANVHSKSKPQGYLQAKDADLESRRSAVEADMKANRITTEEANKRYDAINFEQNNNEWNKMEKTDALQSKASLVNQTASPVNNSKMTDMEAELYEVDTQKATLQEERDKLAQLSPRDEKEMTSQLDRLSDIQTEMGALNERRNSVSGSPEYLDNIENKKNGITQQAAAQQVQAPHQAQTQMIAPSSPAGFAKTIPKVRNDDPTLKMLEEGNMWRTTTHSA